MRGEKLNKDREEMLAEETKARPVFPTIAA
jgi:hypothetical protein